MNSVFAKWPARALGVLLLALPLSGLAESWTLEADEWSRPRSGEAVLEMSAVAGAMRAWQAEPEARLELLYAGGESGELWAAELRDWLIALGAEEDQVETLPGAPEEDILLLRLR